MKTGAIIVAGGMGTRLKARVPKALVKLDRQPLFTYALKIFVRSPLVDEIVLVVPKGREREFQSAIKRLGLKKNIQIVPGGKMRRDSVLQGLNALAATIDQVLIHDAARPFVTLDMIRDVVQVLVKEKAVTVGIPVKPTIKRVDPATGYVEATLDRRFLWDIQTPQGFQKSVILRAHALANDSQATDDAFLVEQSGEKVKVVPGNDRNVKITTAEDLVMAQALIKSKVSRFVR